MNNKNNSSGFTLLELLITLAVIGIVAAIATPNISSWTKSRTVKKEIAQLESLVDYAKSVSVSKSRKLYLLQTNANSMQLFQHKMGTNIQNAENLDTDPANCQYDASNAEQEVEHPNAYNFLSTVKAQHNNSADAGQAAVYNNTNSLMCFFSDGSATAGGFLLEKDCFKFRVDVFLTGFYSRKILTNTTCASGADVWIDR